MRPRAAIALGLLGLFQPLPGCDRVAEVAGLQPAGSGGSFTIALDGSGPPRISARLESRGRTVPLQQVSRRGDHTVWRTPSGDTVTLREGVIVGTTALTPDLFGVDATFPSDWRSAARPLVVDRVHHYVDGDEQPFLRAYRCEVTAPATQSITLGGRSYGARRTDEICGNADQSFTNSYWFDSAGKLLQSRQWLGEDIGYVTVNHVPKQGR